MAAVLDALAPYVKKLIADMAEEEVHMLLGVSGEIKKLEDNTEGLRCFLADAEKRRITEDRVQRLVTKLNGAFYDATDILDVCRLEADKWTDSKCCNKMEGNCFWSLLFCLRNPAFSHKIGGRIKELNQQLEEIHKEAEKFNFINLASYPERRMPESFVNRTMSEFLESDIVGMRIEMDTKELIKVLTDDDERHNLKVVSIVGMGGIGKTTLAQKIFKEADCFRKKIWLSINHQFDPVELIRSAIKHVSGEDPGEERDISLLTRILTDALSANKFLLVMDDMWSEKAWNDALRIPVMKASNKQPGSRVLVTTRFEDLAQKMGASVHEHHVNLLDNEDAWSLLKKQLSPDQVVGIDGLKDVGMQILEKCNGLPLAIKVVGGLLTSRHPTVHEWMEVLNNPAWSVAGLPPDLDKRVYLSYEDLSPQLKQCFLYCSLFPKGQDIWEIEVTSMWISEGFIHQHHHSGADDRLEDVATESYKELIKRNLIEPADGFQINGYKCTMHDVVRSFAEFMAKEESLVVTQQDRQAVSLAATGTIRRLSMGETTTPEAEWAIFLRKQKSLRTLIITSNSTSIRLGDFVRTFSFLRALHIVNAEECDSLVPFLCQLKHLRYLHLEDTDITRLPDDIHRMKSLEHIALVYCTKLGHLPRSIINLVHLRELHLTISNLVAAVVPKGFGRLINLRRLKKFPVQMDNMDGNNVGWCSLQEIGPLSQLRDLTLYGLEKVPAGSWAEKATISSKEHLTYLKLNCSSSSSRYMGSSVDEIEKQQQQEEEEAVEEVFQELRPPSCIVELTIEGYFGRRLPKWMTVEATTTFKSLRNLRLLDLPCCTQLPDGLCRLPSLEILNIVDAPAIKRAGPEFVQASSATPSAVAFPNLRYLYVKGLCEWEEWEWEEDVTAVDVTAMPFLNELTINNSKLSCLPQGLASSKRHALRILNLYELTNLAYVENFPSVMELDVFDCPELERISGLSRLQKIRIVRCSKLQVLIDVPALDSLVLEDATMEALPEYLRGVNPRYIELDCSRKLSGSLSPDGSEWDKIKHIRNHKIIYLD